MGISKKKITLLLIYFTFGLLMYLIMNLIQYSSMNIWIDTVNIILLFLLILQYSFMKKLQIELLSLIGIFLTFTYLFHFGNVILLSSPLKELGLGQLVIKNVDIEIFKSTVSYCLYFVYALFLGVILAANKPLKIKQREQVDELRNLKISRIVGYILYIVGFPIFIFISYKNISISATSSYLDIFEFEQTIPSYVKFLKTMMSVGVCLLLIGYKGNMKAVYIIISTSIFLQILSMLSGGRGFAVISIVMYVYIYHKFVKKIVFKNFIFIFIVGYLGMAFLSSLAILRDSGLNLGLIAKNILLKLSSDNLVFSFLNEFGGTLLTPAIVINNIPRIIEPYYGLTYLNGILNLVGLNIGDSRIDSFVNVINIGAMGGSYIGEVYFNFMNASWIIAILIGFLICKASLNVDKINFNGKYINVAYYMPFFVGVNWWVRDSFGYFVKISIVGALLILILKLMVEIIFIKNKSVK